MKYRRLEFSFLALSCSAVLLSIVVSFSQQAQYSEILGQALVVPILFIALHYGRQSGFLAATIGAFIFLIAKVQEANALSMATLDGQLVIGRAVLFGLIGIFGSELAMRTKYLIVRLSDNDQIDGPTNLYSQHYLRKLITRLFSEYHRHARPFSILFVTPDWACPLEDRAREKAVAKIANIIRGNVRLIDEVGYLSDNCFCLVFPETQHLAARLVFGRLEKVYGAHQETIAGNPGLICERILSMPENEAEIKAMLPNRDMAQFIA